MELATKEQKMNMNKDKVKVFLKESIGREPKESEVINSLSDPTFLIKILTDEVEKLIKRVEKLEGKLTK